jgi:myo-inositol catabolism protein IolC
VPVEAASAFPLEWISPGSLYRLLLERPPSWLVKVLWRTGPGLDPAIHRRQLERLTHLCEVCAHLARRLIVEVVWDSATSAEGSEQRAAALAAAIDAAYRLGVEPHWWKVPGAESAPEWQTITRVLDEHDPEARLLVLSGGAERSQLERWLRVARTTHHGAGFAVGRTLFWSAWQRLLSGDIGPSAVEGEVAQGYASLVELWRGMGAAMPEGGGEVGAAAIALEGSGAGARARRQEGPG